MPEVNWLAVLAATVAAFVLGGVATGFAAGLCWVATSFGINGLFQREPLGLVLINAGYHTLQFTLVGLILGLWP